MLTSLAWIACTAPPSEPVRQVDDPVVHPSNDTPPPESVTEEPPTGSPVSVPLFGGTMAAVEELRTIVAADPEGGRVLLLDEDTEEVRILDLGANSRPFRVEVEGGDAFVTLRGTGEVVRVDVELGAVVWRMPVCAEPRGLDHTASGELAVACAGGELVRLDDAGNTTGRLRLPTDLRDVVGVGDTLFVSRFREASVVLVDAARWEVEVEVDIGTNGHEAWRMRTHPSGDGVVLIYDEVSTDPITTADPSLPPAYYSARDCRALHQPKLASVFADGSVELGGAIDSALLPVDFLVLGGEVFVVNGMAAVPNGEPPAWFSVLDSYDPLTADQCLTAGPYALFWAVGQPSALALGATNLYVQTAGHVGLHRADGVEPIWAEAPTAPAIDEPFTLFHRDPGSGISCASCHPEGLDDGNVWTFDTSVSGVALGGPRKTPSLVGGILDRAPYHWMGELPTPADLVHSTYTVGMGSGREVPADAVDKLFAWLDDLPTVSATPDDDDDALARGAALFASHGCTACHGTAPPWTTNAVVDVGTGAPYKTPSLVGLGLRLSYLHDGCAKELEDRFLGPVECTGGDRHGTVSTLTESDRRDLVAWLRTL